MVNQCFELCTSRVELVASSKDASLASLLCASAACHRGALSGIFIFAQVRLIFQCWHTILRNPIERLIHLATSASIATSVAGQDVLHRQIN
jgi:hypothetical protein